METSARSSCEMDRFDYVDAEWQPIATSMEVTILLRDRHEVTKKKSSRNDFR